MITGPGDVSLVGVKSRMSAYHLSACGA